MRKKQILYVMGAGRSGTTIADIILGNQRGFFSCGELNRFPVRQGVSPIIKGKRNLFWDGFNNNLLSVFSMFDLNSLLSTFSMNRP